MLKPNNTWFDNPYGIERPSITKISIKDTYVSSNSDKSWDCSAEQDGSIHCYVNGSELIIAGNDSGKIIVNPQSAFLFCEPAKKNTFKNVTIIEGANLLDMSQATSLERCFQSCFKLVSIDVSNWDTSNVINMNGTFSQCYQLINPNVSAWKTGKVTDMSYMFQLARSITELNLSSWDLSNVTTIKAMFQGHSSVGSMNLITIGNVSNWNTHNIIDMTSTFKLCDSLKVFDGSKWDVSNVITFDGMFSHCAALNELYISDWKTLRATNMEFMFYECRSLGSIDLSKWDVSSVLSFDHFAAHSYAKILGVEKWKNSIVENLGAFCHSWRNEIIDLSGFDVKNVISISQLFEHDNTLKKVVGIENWDTPNCVDFNEMFSGCSSLKEIDLSKLDTRKAKDGVVISSNGGVSLTCERMFNECISLEKITVGPNFSYNGDSTTTDPTHYAIAPVSNNPEYDGSWYSQGGEAFSPEDAFKSVPTILYSTKKAMRSEPVMILNGTLVDIGEAIRSKKMDNLRRLPSEMASAINSITTI